MSIPWVLADTAAGAGCRLRAGQLLYDGGPCCGTVAEPQVLYDGGRCCDIAVEPQVL
jgi:hypothetical protein